LDLATIGGVSGGIQAVPDDKATQIEAELNAVLNDVGKQEALQSKVIEAAARSNIRAKAIGVESTRNLGGVVDYRSVSSLDADTVLEVGLVKQLGLRDVDPRCFCNPGSPYGIVYLDSV
jgi:hypothetical protein